MGECVSMSLDGRSFQFQVFGDVVVTKVDPLPLLSVCHALLDNVQGLRGGSQCMLSPDDKQALFLRNFLAAYPSAMSLVSILRQLCFGEIHAIWSIRNTEV